jgi:hypothetical protein
MSANWRIDEKLIKMFLLFHSTAEISRDEKFAIERELQYLFYPSATMI